MLNKIRLFINNHFVLFVFLMFTILVFSLYGKTMFFDWTYLDDDVLILDRQNYLKFSNIKNIFCDTVFAQGGQDKFCRPLLNISFTLDKFIYNINPFGYHLTNILIHLFNVFFIFFLLSKYYDKRKTFLIVLLFAVHPSITQAVAWIPGRNDSLLTLFSVISFLFLHYYIDTKKLYCFLLYVLSFVCVLLIKETAILLPVFYVFYLYLKKSAKKEYVYIVISSLSVIILYLIYRYFVLKYQTFSASFGFLLKNTFYSFPVITKYIANVCCPFRISVFVSQVQVYYLLSVCSMLILFLFSLLLKVKFNLRILFGISWFFLFLIPPFVMPSNQFYDHRIYLPLIGIVIVLEEIIKNTNIGKKQIIPFILAFFVFFIIAYFHSDKFKNKEIFWVSAYMDSPNSAVTNSRIADLLTDSGHYDKAIEKYLKAIEIEKHSRYFVNLSVCYIRMGKLDEAENVLLQALSLRQDNPIIYYNLANIYKYKGDMEKAKKMKYLYIKVFNDTNKNKKPLDINL